MSNVYSPVKIGTTVLEECYSNLVNKCSESVLHDQSSLVSEALQLAATGMGIVFIFLALLVLVVKITSCIINKFCQVETELHNSPPRQNQTQLNTGSDLQAGDVKAAIFAAIHKFRQKSIN